MRITRTIETLKRRAEFLRASKIGASAAAKALVAQAARHERTVEEDCIHVGFTVTGKVGNAVVRNRIKRRLRAAAREVLPSLGKPELYYVVIGRRAALTRPYVNLVKDLRYALHTVHGQIEPGSGNNHAG